MLTKKITISLPIDVLERLEKISQKKKLKKSVVIQQLIQAEKLN